MRCPLFSRDNSSSRLFSSGVCEWARTPAWESLSCSRVAHVSFIGQETDRESRAPVGLEGDCQVMRKMHHIGLLIAFVCLATGVARAQSFRVQCPTSTITHPTAATTEPAYTAPTFTSGQTYVTSKAGHVNGAIKCQQISGGDGFATMGDGTQTYLFSFGPLSGLVDI